MKYSSSNDYAGGIYDRNKNLLDSVQTTLWISQMNHDACTPTSSQRWQRILINGTPVSTKYSRFIEPKHFNRIPMGISFLLIKGKMNRSDQNEDILNVDVGNWLTCPEDALKLNFGSRSTSKVLIKWTTTPLKGSTFIYIPMHLYSICLPWQMLSSMRLENAFSKREGGSEAEVK